MSEETFKDHFSKQAEVYQQYRPGYPPALFDWLAGISPQHECAWDCATGSGQAARQLARHFIKVIATDASQAQLDQAKSATGVQYQCCPAETTPFENSSINLISVAQALHWFDHEQFYSEAKRVLSPAGVLAVWTYNLLSITPQLDSLINHFYTDILGQYWAFERRHIENGYQDLPFPFNEITTPAFAMQTDWTVEHLLGYLSSWSAVQACIKATQHDPLAELTPQLREAWGKTERRAVSWPLTLRVGHI